MWPSLQDAGEPTTETAQRAIALEMQSRYLHPGWLQAQKAEGYSGTLQVLKAVQFAWGWQAVAPDTVRSDHWQSFYDVLVRDKHQLGLPEWLKEHPQAYAQSLERLVQAQRQGYWQADADTQKQLAQMYQELTRAAPLAAELPSVRRWVERAARGESVELTPPAGMAIVAPQSPALAAPRPAPPPLTCPRRPPRQKHHLPRPPCLPWACCWSGSRSQPLLTAPPSPAPWSAWRASWPFWSWPWWRWRAPRGRRAVRPRCLPRCNRPAFDAWPL